jgi:hypothetical protein
MEETDTAKKTERLNEEAARQKTDPAQTPAAYRLIARILT